MRYRRLGLALFCFSLGCPREPITSEKAAPPPPKSGGKERTSASTSPAAAPRGQTRYVQAPETFRLRRDGPALTALERLPIGTQLVIDPAKPPSTPELRKILSGGSLEGGYVRLDDLAVRPPEFRIEYAFATQALEKAQLVEAETHAGRAAALNDKDRRSLEILAAIYDVRKDAKRARPVYARLRELGPRKDVHPKAAPEPAEALAPKSKAYVNATRLRLRQEASVTSPVVTELRLNSELIVLSSDPDWTRVELPAAPRAVSTLSFDSAVLVTDAQEAPTAPQEASELEQASGAAHTGYVATRYLSTHALDSATLLSEAKSLEARGEVEDALEVYARAALLSRDRALFEHIAQLATFRERYVLAASAALELEKLAEGAGGRTEVSLAFGCDGDPRDALFAKAKGVGVHCVTDVDVDPPCPPIEPTGPTEIEYEGAELKRAIEEYESSGRAAAEKKAYQDAKREWQKKQHAFEARLDGLKKKYPGPVLRLVLEGEEDDALFAYSIAFEVAEAYCGNVFYEAKEARLIPKPIPWPGSGKSAQVILRVPAYENVVYGFVRAHELREAQQKVRAAKARGAGDPQISSGGVSISVLPYVCAQNECGC